MTYVAVGDSYGAGVGGGQPADDCGRSEAGYPMAVARALGQELRFEACQGATTSEAIRWQIDAITPDASLVTATVGGNDLDFTDVLTVAAKPAWLADSGPLLARIEQRVSSELPELLRLLYTTVRGRAPAARVVVLGYPALFSGKEDCSPITFFTDQEIARLNAIADQIATVMAGVSAAADVEFVDMRTEFANHGTCSDDEWLHGVSWTVEESYHPNAKGHEAYGRVALAAIGRADLATQEAMSQPLPKVTYGPTPRRPYPVFTPPDLTSTESLASAAEWGLDPCRVAQLGQRTSPQRGVSSVDPEAVQVLNEMDYSVRQRRGWA